MCRAHKRALRCEPLHEAFLAQILRKQYNKAVQLSHRLVMHFGN